MQMVQSRSLNQRTTDKFRVGNLCSELRVTQQELSVKSQISAHVARVRSRTGSQTVQGWPVITEGHRSLEISRYGEVGMFTISSVPAF
jgi:hypothetical protein